MLSGSLDATVTADGVRFVFSVTNEGDATVELTFTDGRDADLAVFSETDRAPPTATQNTDDPIWRWSDGRLFTQAIRNETLDSGETRVMNFEWSDPEPGSYTVVATLEAETHDSEAHAEFSV